MLKHTSFFHCSSNLVIFPQIFICGNPMAVLAFFYTFYKLFTGYRVVKKPSNVGYAHTASAFIPAQFGPVFSVTLSF